jgi:hypothetical protein
MARNLPFQVPGHCIDCGTKARRDGAFWRCWPCNNTMRDMRAKASLAVKRAITTGEIAPPLTLICVDCEQPASCYDHRDYRRPLDVSPVCDRCNQRRGPAAWRDEAFIAAPALEPA